MASAQARAFSPEARPDTAAFPSIRRSYLASFDHAEQITRDEGRVTLKLHHEEAALPVARTSVPQQLVRLDPSGVQGSV